MYPFKEIRYSPLGETPATTDIYSGVLTLNSDIWPKLPAHFQRFILLHEQAHLEKLSRSEDQANAWAIENFLDYSTDETFAATFGQLAEIINIIETADPATRARAKKAMQEQIQGQSGQANFWSVILAVVSVLWDSEAQKGAEKEGILQQYWKYRENLANEIELQREQQRQKDILKKMIPFAIAAVIIIGLIIFR